MKSQSLHLFFMFLKVSLNRAKVALKSIEKTISQTIYHESLNRAKVALKFSFLKKAGESKNKFKSC